MWMDPIYDNGVKKLNPLAVRVLDSKNGGCNSAIRYVHYIHYKICICNYVIYVARVTHIVNYMPFVYVVDCFEVS